MRNLHTEDGDNMHFTVVTASAVEVACKVSLSYLLEYWPKSPPTTGALWCFIFSVQGAMI